MNKILLIDGHNLLFQMFFGMPSRITNKEGRGIWGVIGFVGALRKIIAMTRPTHLAVLFDGQHKNERKEINQDYKANRIDYSEVEEDENPFSQLPDIYRALDILNIPHIETEDCEVDDWMAGYAEKYGSDNEIVISSFDSDFFQLISSNVKILRYRGDCSVLCDESYLYDKFGIPPCRYAEFKSLVGDSADNIRGAEKIGPKTARELLAAYGSLEGIIENSDKIPRSCISSSISSCKDRLRDNLRIIKLGRRDELPFELSELEYKTNSFSTNQVLFEIGLLP